MKAEQGYDEWFTSWTTATKQEQQERVQAIADWLAWKEFVDALDPERKVMSNITVMRPGPDWKEG